MEIPELKSQAVLGGGNKVVCSDCGDVGGYGHGTNWPEVQSDRSRALRSEHLIEHLIEYATAQNERIEKLEDELEKATEYLAYLSPSWE